MQALVQTAVNHSHPRRNLSLHCLEHLNQLFSLQCGGSSFGLEATWKNECNITFFRLIVHQPQPMLIGTCLLLGDETTELARAVTCTCSDRNVVEWCLILALVLHTAMAHASLRDSWGFTYSLLYGKIRDKDTQSTIQHFAQHVC